MTGSAFDSLGTLGELAVVLVLVAVGALGEGEFLLEIAFKVTGLALDGLMFSR